MLAGIYKVRKRRLDHFDLEWRFGAKAARSLLESTLRHGAKRARGRGVCIAAVGSWIAGTLGGSC